MNNLKKTALFFFMLPALFLFVGLGPVWSEEKIIFLKPLEGEPEINSELQKIDSEQYLNLIDKGKYEFQFPKRINNRIYTTHEYQTPNGSIGYQTLIEDKGNIISIAVGEEKEQRTFKEKIIYESFNTK